MPLAQSFEFSLFGLDGAHRSLKPPPEVSTSEQAAQLLITGLPLLDPFYRVDQHQDIQDQAVPDPEKQHYLYRNE